MRPGNSVSRQESMIALADLANPSVTSFRYERNLLKLAATLGEPEKPANWTRHRFFRFADCKPRFITLGGQFEAPPGRISRLELQ
jgi:hypothetical protein